MSLNEVWLRLYCQLHSNVQRVEGEPISIIEDSSLAGDDGEGILWPSSVALAAMLQSLPDLQARTAAAAVTIELVCGPPPQLWVLACKTVWGARVQAGIDALPSGPAPSWSPCACGKVPFHVRHVHSTPLLCLWFRLGPSPPHSGACFVSQLNYRHVDDIDAFSRMQLRLCVLGLCRELVWAWPALWCRSLVRCCARLNAQVQPVDK